MRFFSLPTETRLGITYVSISGVLWGTIGIAAQSIYHQADVTPLAIGFWRLALAFPIVAIACWFVVGKKVFSVKQRHTLKMISIGIMLALYQAAFFSAIDYVGVTVATLITLCLAPVLVALMSMLFLKEELSQNTLGSLSLAILGAALLVGFPGEISNNNDLLTGISLSFVSSLGYAIVTLLSRSLAGACHPLHLSTVSFAVGALILSPLTFLGKQEIYYSKEVWGLLAYLGVVPTAFGYILLFLGIKYIKASTASILTMLEPLVAACLAWVLFAERLSPISMIGAILLLISIAVLYKAEAPIQYDEH